jgi:uncharacterized membrane protein YidH (DUF202 family)
MADTQRTVVAWWTALAITAAGWAFVQRRRRNQREADTSCTQSSAGEPATEFDVVRSASLTVSLCSTSRLPTRYHSCNLNWGRLAHGRKHKIVANLPAH